MQYAKYFVVAGGVIGLLGLFLPSISGTVKQACHRRVLAYPVGL